MRINRIKQLPKKYKLVVGGVLAATMLTASVAAESLVEPVTREVGVGESTVADELETLLKDYQELEEMAYDTEGAEKEISARIILLKAEIRTFIESTLDLPVTLDGELLTYEESSQEKKYIDEEIGILEPDWPEKIGVQEENGFSFYYYTKRTIYQFDVDEDCLMSLIRFVNSKTAPTQDSLLEVLRNYRTAKEISYGYRTAFLTCIDEKSEVGKNRETTVYTGTIFNNSQYSLRTNNLIEKILLKIKSDYVERTGSTYSPTEYVIKKVDGRWLIIHSQTGATDLLSDEEGQLCGAVGQVQLCMDENGLLSNDKNTDFQIEVLQGVLEQYLTKKEEKAK